MSKIAILSAVAVLALVTGHSVMAQESTTVLGPTLFDECANAAASAQKIGKADRAGIDTCSQAIGRSWSTVGETAAAFLNRGTLHLVRGENEQAAADFSRAIKASPSLAAAYNDRGVAYSALHRSAEAVRDFTTALSLKADNADQVLFNRAMAHEDQGDLKLAYLDYRAAADLNPQWDLPAKQLARFSVGHSPAS